MNMNREVNHLLLCRKGEIRFTSNLFGEELFRAGEMIFIPRTADYWGKVSEDARIILHSFDNSVYRPQSRGSFLDDYRGRSSL